MLTVQVEYTYTMPYTGTFLEDPLSYPVKLWVNDAIMMRRIDVYDGMDIELDRDVRFISTSRMRSLWLPPVLCGEH